MKADRSMAQAEILKAGLAARIHGVDAAQASDTDVAFIRRQLLDCPVLVLPGQTLSETQQADFASRFGPLEGYDYASNDYNKGQRPELLTISNRREESSPLDVMSRSRMLDIGNKLWHSDSSFRQIPGHLSFLYGIEVTSAGGETEFADMRAGYDALDDTMKAAIGGLVAEHSIIHSRSMLGFDDWNEEFREKFGGWAAHGIVRTLPESGRKTLFLSSHASHIVGLPVPVGRMLLHELTEISTTPDKVFTHRWTKGDLVIWDNRCTLHRLRRYRSSDEQRTLRRVTTLAKEFPAVDPAAVKVADWVLDAVA